jgi:aspartyl-tRNA(Asn)/glutamyl-tRNA(Gln) amidotransferase subunit A
MRMCIGRIRPGAAVHTGCRALWRAFSDTRFGLPLNAVLEEAVQKPPGGRKVIKATVARDSARDLEILHPASMLAAPGLCVDPSRRSFLKLAGMGATGFAVGLGPRAEADPPAIPGHFSAHATDQLTYLTVQEVAALIRSRKISPVELTQACLTRIEALNGSLNAFITVTAESALADARRAESEVQHGRWLGPLHGVPIALKDLIDTAGVRTTGASALYKDRIPTEDATVVKRLKDAGAILLGKLNMHELAYGGTSVPSFYGRVSNPWDLQRITGGSSGGSAAAVAAGLCYAALGSDTGGSVREPAALCGIVGLKPTYGRVSNRGVMPLAWSMDHVGPMARTVTDSAIVLQAIAGYDPGDVVSQNRPVGSYVEGAAARVPLRVGLPREFFFADLDPDIQMAIDQALKLLGAAGAKLVDVPLEVSTDRTVFRSEAYTAQAENIEKTPELFIPETLAKFKAGAAIDAPTYIQARRELERLRRSTLSIFSSVDVLVTPTTRIAAPKAADYPQTVEGAMALDGQLLHNTRPFNLFGLPTISVPCGFTGAGLPIGMQISGPTWEERRVLTVARAFEAATEWHKRRPPVAQETHS